MKGFESAMMEGAMKKPPNVMREVLNLSLAAIQDVEDSCDEVSDD